MSKQVCKNNQYGNLAENWFGLVFIYLDSRIQLSHDGVLRYLLPASVESVRSILTIIAGAMMGIAGTVYSITLVVLTLASSQLGSRLVRNYMYDKLNQVV